MAAFGHNDNTEMGSETNVYSEDLSEFIRTYDLPQCVCVTDGNFLSRHVQISSGDVLLLKSCDRGQVTLSYRDEISHQWTEVSVDLDYPQKFNVLPPKDTNSESRTVSMVTYPTISDLLLDCPTYFEATASYDDPYLPNMSVNTGDRFWFVGIINNPKDGIDRLKVRDEKGNFLLLSLQCRGNFCPLKDDKEYTVKELVELASVQRRLKMVVGKPTEGSSDTIEKADKVEHSADTPDTYAVVVKDRSQSYIRSSLSSSKVDVNVAKPDLLPKLFSGIIHLLKHESSLAVSPYNDLETTWYIPVSANLKVRTYSQNDYEVPEPRKQMFQTRVPLPLNDELPRFPAPSAPPLQQPLVPININNFVDIYGSTFPVKAKIMDTSEAHPFYRKVLKNIDEVIVYRMDEIRRLYVKDSNRDTVYSLSHDCKLSFVEYPEKFKTVSELLHLPVGTDVRVLEDIAADFPQPFSLRLGDIIRLTSNTPYFVKLKHMSRDCQVIKCERIDPGGGENKKLKLPMDFEMSMVIATDSNNKRMISLQDLLTGVVPIPSTNVASVPDESEDSVLKELPVDLRILKSMKELCIVASSTSIKFPSSVLASKTYRSSNCGNSFKEKAGATCSRQESVLFTNIGLPLTSGIILAFRDRLDLFELDVVESEADYIRLPLEKMTMAQFEERDRLRKLNSDYEDFEFGSSSTLDECGAGNSNLTRTGSAGVLDSKQKSTKMDKVLRLSRALNPKHWRHSKAEPEPLPHPSAMGLMALAARPRDDVSNDYHHSHVDYASAKTESLKGGSIGTCASTASSEEDENFYEDVEIGPLKSSTLAPTTSRQTGAFSGPAHRSLPPRMLPSQVATGSDSKARGTSDDTTQTASVMAASAGIEAHTYDVPKPFTKAKNWATNLGNNIGERMNMKPKYDVPKSNKVKDYQKEQIKTQSNATSVDKTSPDIKPPLPPAKADNKTLDLADRTDSGSAPIPPARRKGKKSPSQIGDLTKTQTSKEEPESPQQQQRIYKSISLIDSAQSTNKVSDLPKPKPRGLKKPVSLQEDQPSLQLPLPKSRSANTIRVADLSSIKARPSTVISEVSPNVATHNLRPKPPPKPKAATHTTV